MSEKYTVPRIKIVLVGDGATGKTSLLQRFADGTFNEEYVPTIFENQAKKIQVNVYPMDSLAYQSLYFDFSWMEKKSN